MVKGKAEPEETSSGFNYMGKSLDKIDKRLEKMEERLLSVEKEVSALRVWGSILSFLLPSLLLSLLLWKPKIP